MGGRERFREVFDAALTRRRVTLSEVRERLAAQGHTISLTTLSYWRAGQRVPARRASLDALPSLEAILGLQPGELSDRLEEAPTTPYDELIGLPVDGSTHPAEPLVRLTAQVVVDVGADGEIVRATARQVALAEEDGVEGTVVHVRREGDSEPRIRALGGCSVAETWEQPTGTRSARLCFDRPLRRGEETLWEVEVTWSEPIQPTDFPLVTSQRLEEALLWVRFHPDRIPARAWVDFAEGGLGQEDEIRVVGAAGVHHRQTGFGPGTLKVRWEW